MKSLTIDGIQIARIDDQSAKMLTDMARKCVGIEGASLAMQMNSPDVYTHQGVGQVFKRVTTRYEAMLTLSFANTTEEIETTHLARPSPTNGADRHE